MTAHPQDFVNNVCMCIRATGLTANKFLQKQLFRIYGSKRLKYTHRPVRQYPPNVINVICLTYSNYSATVIIIWEDRNDGITPFRFTPYIINYDQVPIKVWEWKVKMEQGSITVIFSIVDREIVLQQWQCWVEPSCRRSFFVNCPTYILCSYGNPCFEAAKSELKLRGGMLATIRV
jgi:hypothetical protein